jgi:hypothetical protein
MDAASAPSNEPTDACEPAAAGEEGTASIDPELIVISS